MTWMFVALLHNNDKQWCYVCRILEPWPRCPLTVNNMDPGIMMRLSLHLGSIDQTPREPIEIKPIWIVLSDSSFSSGLYSGCFVIFDLVRFATSGDWFIPGSIPTYSWVVHCKFLERPGDYCWLPANSGLNLAVPIAPNIDIVNSPGANLGGGGGEKGKNSA